MHNEYMALKQEPTTIHPPPFTLTIWPTLELLPFRLHNHYLHIASYTIWL